MVVILATLVIGTESRPTFEEAAAKARADTVGSRGCLRYEFSRDLGNPDTFHISEVWSTAADFDAHVASGHHDSFRAALATCTVLERRIDRFDAPLVTRLA